MELDCLDLLDAEVQDRLWDEDQGLLEHVQPSCLGFYVCLDAGLPGSGFEVVSGLDQVQPCSCVYQFNEDLELGPGVLRFQLLKVRVIVLRLRTDLGLDINLNLLLDLDDNIPIHSLTLIYGFVLIEL